MAKRDGKTEQATQRRRREARREGQLPRSQETNSMLVLSVAVLTFGSTAPGALRASAEVMRDWLRGADPALGIRKGPIMSSALKMAVAWFPPVIAAVVTGITATLAQGGLVLAPKTGRPSLKQLSWKRGLQQMSPKKAGYTLLRNVLKFAIVGGAMLSPVQKLWAGLPTADTLGGAVAMTGRTLNSVTTRVVLGAAAIAAIDQVVTRRRWRGELMMTKREVMDESKANEGDPHAKAMRKRRAMELRRRRSTRSVAFADVVITNPTHFAVALAYAPGSVAPQVIAKGTEHQAKKIRKEASRHGVPIIENRPLARALYRQVQVGGYVPEKFFDDVVKVLVAAYWRRGHIPAHVNRTPVPTGAVA